MKSNYKKLAPYIRQIDERNTEDIHYELLGVSVDKWFIKSIANTVGTDWRGYKKIQRGQFCYIPDTSRRGDKIGIALQCDYDIALVSQAYTVFEISDTNTLLPEYLNLWFKRPEFDRYARFHSHGSVREIFDWEEMCDVELPIPEIAEQQKIVDAYNTIEHRIALKRKINDNLEVAEQAFLSQILCKDGQAIALGEIVEFIDGDRGKNYPTFDEFTSEGYCLFLNASNVTSTGFNFDSCMFVTKEKDLAMRKGHLSPFDIVFTSRGTLGNVALYDENVSFENIRINSGMLILRPKTNLFDQFALYSLLKS